MATGDDEDGSTDGKVDASAGNAVEGVGLKPSSGAAVRKVYTSLGSARKSERGQRAESNGNDKGTSPMSTSHSQSRPGVKSNKTRPHQLDSSSEKPSRQDPRGKDKQLPGSEAQPAPVFVSGDAAMALERPAASSPPTTPRERKPVTRPNPVANADATGKLKAELTQLRRRYGSTFSQCDGPEGGCEVAFEMPITDPDFPFDVSALQLTIRFPRGYPETSFATFSVRNGNIPEAVRRRIQNRMDAASEGMPRGELNIKPLLRLLERNLEKWMIPLPTIVPSAGSSTVKFIAAQDIAVSPAVSPLPASAGPLFLVPARGTKSMFTTSSSPSSSSPSSSPLTAASMTMAMDEVAKSLELATAGVPVKREMASRTRFQPPEFIRLDAIGSSSRAGTIMIKLKTVNLSNIGLAVPVQLGLVLCCTRCHRNTATADIRPDVDRTIPCSNCSQHLQLTYLRDALHLHNSVVGYVRVKRAVPVDLLPSTYQFTCAACAPNDPLAGSLKVEGVGVGEKIRYACRNCQASCAFSYEGVSWSEMAPSIEAAAAKATPSVVAAKLPTKVGEPLPNHGTCVHYRKSCRWFRFPCCGRVYPCDECHDADPTSTRHTAEWATRQICGFCSREFSTSQKFCVCGETPGAATKHTAHWEGGKGTRDQTAMSKKDRKKYRNQEKTVSSRAAARTK